MTKMVGARQLHELYGTTNRRRHFPEAGWHHLVLAARNTAAAFQTLHSAGIVVGDVNQGNLLVDNRHVRADDRLRFVPNHARAAARITARSARRTSRRRSCRSQKLRDVDAHRRTTTGSAWPF